MVANNDEEAFEDKGEERGRGDGGRRGRVGRVDACVRDGKRRKKRKRWRSKRRGNGNSAISPSVKYNFAKIRLPCLR